MKIGNLEVGQLFLAPMAGITDPTFRTICKSYGASVMCSEMVSAKGLYYNDKKTHELMHIEDNNHPCAIQIFGSDPDIMAQIVPKVEEEGCDFIDINMGCPMPKIVNNGDGSALLKNPGLVGKIVKSVSDAATVPVTVKIRKGWDETSINAVEVAKAIEENGAMAIAVHGRTRMQFYSGVADWDIIARVKEAVKIPVIGNGDIFSANDAKRMLNHTNCDAFMIGRGAQGNPFIFKQITEFLEYGEVKTYPSAEDKIKAALYHAKMLVKDKGEKRGIMEARKHIAWYIKGLSGSAKLKTEVFKVSDFATLEKLFNDYIGKAL
ncbi:MAG: tRNA dihydrouridine synthase DusB [Clostridia bacterium]|nr:tRNA dihydrouridine synthase DusB [Clostridia bacterium]